MDERNSRTILAIGEDALKNVQNGSIAIFGMNAIGTEIAKSLLLFGCNKLIFADERVITEKDVKSNFYVSENDIGKPRSSIIAENLQKLNKNCKIILKKTLEINEIVNEAQVLCFCQPLGFDEIVHYDEFCRENGKGFIYVDEFSFASFIFQDFGAGYEVKNRYGKQPTVLKIRNVTRSNPGEITFVGKTKPYLGETMKVKISGVESMKELNECGIVTIKTKDFRSHIIDTTSFSEYDSEHPTGFIEEIIPTETVDFKKYKECVESGSFASCFMDNRHKSVLEFFLERQKKNEKGEFYLQPVAVFMGAIAASECIKFMTRNLMPIKQQIFVSNFDELFDLQTKETKELNLSDKNILVVGVGALGCEIAKIASLAGIKHMTLVDPDDIELSNLNRQLLFTEETVGKNKAETAKETILKHRNNNSIDSFPQLINQQTREQFGDSFFEKHDVTFSLVDSFGGRAFIEDCCARVGIPMFTGGIGKYQGDWACAIPHITERYHKINDVEQSTPSCTLRNFPHKKEHCVEWAHNQLLKIINSEKEVVDINQCVQEGITYFLNKFNYNIRNLRFYHPKDEIVKGAPYWSSHRIYPDYISFDKENPMHVQLLKSYALLCARKNKEISTEKIDEIIRNVKINEEWKEPTLKSHGFDDDTEENKHNKKVDYTKQFNSTDQLELDFIEAASNIRADNYKLESIPRIFAMQHAAKISPTIPTTNSIVASNIWLLFLCSLVNKEEVRSGFYASSDFVITRRMQSGPKTFKLGATEKTFTNWDFIHLKSTMKVLDAQNMIKEMSGSEVFSWTTETGILLPVVGSSIFGKGISQDVTFNDIIKTHGESVLLELMLDDEELLFPRIIIRFC